MPKEKSELESEKQTVQWPKEKDKKTNNDLPVAMVWCILLALEYHYYLLAMSCWLS
jgi:hypothetical protein